MGFPPRRSVTLFTVLVAASPIGLTPVAAQPANARVDSLFSFATPTTPGCAVAAIKDGQLLFARGYGLADIEHQVAISRQTPFYMASTSKQFAAGAINLLALDGKLSLDDDVRKFVPELPQFGAPITVRHLLTHTSGLRDYFGLFGMAGYPSDYPITNGAFLEMMRRQRTLNFPTGTQYSYSNSGYVLLSIIVERASGQSLRDFSAERFFTPLGMRSTQFRDQHNQLVPNRALAYGRNARGEYVHAVPYFDVVGDGGLYSTVEDIARWEANFLEPKVGGVEWLRLEQMRGRLNDGTMIAYGAGLVHGKFRGDSIIEHGGSLGGYNINLLRFPARRMSVAVLCNDNTRSASQLSRGVAEIFLGDVLAPVSATAATPTASSPPATTSTDGNTLAKFTGTWFSPSTNLVRRVVADQGRLYFERAPGSRSELASVGVSRFVIMTMNTTAIFSRRADSLRLEQDGAPAQLFVRVTPPTKALSAYAGSYRSAELRATMTVTPRDSIIMLRTESGDSLRLTGVFVDGFSGALFVRFLRGAGGTVTAMEVSAGDRARNVRFERMR